MADNKAVEIDQVKEKLIKLLQHDNCPLFMVFGEIEGLADYLIANGVTVLTEDEQRNVYTVKEIEEIQGEAYDLGAESVLHNHFGLSWHDAEKVRKEVAQLRDAQKWIPATERLPKPGERVLVCIGAVFEAFIDDGGKWQRYYSAPLNEVLGEPTHWMPLPQPPKGE